MNFIELRKEWDGVAYISSFSKYNTRGIQAYIQALHKRGEIVRCFRSRVENMIWLCHRKPRLPDFFRLPPIRRNKE